MQIKLIIRTMTHNKYIFIFTFLLFCITNVSAQRYLDNAIRRPDERGHKIRLGITAGVTMSDLTSATGLDIWNGLAFFNLNEEYIGFTDTRTKIGFQAGFKAQAQLTGNWYWQASLLYTQKGYKLESQDIQIDAQAAYIQLPLEIMYKFPVGRADLLASVGCFLGVGIHGFTDYNDNFNQDPRSRTFRQDLQRPYVNEEYGKTNLVGCDYTVHGANVFWYDEDDTFKTPGTYKIDGGVQLGLGWEIKRFQLMLTYQFSLTYLYNYNYDYSARYTEFGGKYADYHNSFEYFGMDVMTSPRQHVLGVSVSYFFDNFKHNLRL